MKFLIPILMLALLACNGKSDEQKKEIPALAKKPEIDFDMGSSPEAFSAKTTDGSTFNSQDYIGKYWVVFVYGKNYLTKSDSYDMVAELNETHKKFGDKIPMIGIFSGISGDDIATKKLLENAKFTFKQIDNSQNIDREKVINESTWCTPAKIIINPKGKVIYNGCGGGGETLEYKLDSLIHTEKW